MSEVQTNPAEALGEDLSEAGRLLGALAAKAEEHRWAGALAGCEAFLAWLDHHHRLEEPLVRELREGATQRWSAEHRLAARLADALREALEDHNLVRAHAELADLNELLGTHRRLEEQLLSSSEASAGAP